MTPFINIVTLLIKMQQIEDKIIEIVSQKFQNINCGHDIHHLIRVKNIALTIAKKEGGDSNLIIIAALVHDVHRLMEKQANETIQPIKSLPLVKEILEQANVEENIILQVLPIVKNHELWFNGVWNGGTHHPIEIQILQDADALDAIGAIGIVRCIQYGASYNLPFHDPLITLEEPVYENGRSLTGMNHIKFKLLEVGLKLNTKTAQLMAQKRHEYMEEFYNQFLKEWGGDV